MYAIMKNFTGYMPCVEYNRNIPKSMNMTKPFPSLIDTLPPFGGHFTARELRGDQANVLFASYPAGTSIPSHSHDTENIGVVTQGTLELLTNGRSSLYRCGDWYHLPAGQEHAAFFPEDTAIVEFWFHRNKD